jgi:hemerythrin-like domain-containing protein
MKRDPALRELSSDHHHALVHARRLVKAAGLVEDAAASTRVAHDFLAFWAEHINAHFHEEEELLLPAFARYGDPWEPAVVRVLVEHVQLRRLVGDLSRRLQAGELFTETMRMLGILLRDHIRHEENVLFPMIERALPEDALAQIGSALNAFQD